MKRFSLLVLLCAFVARADDVTNSIWASGRDIKCTAFKSEYRFLEGYRGGNIGDPIEAFTRLVAVQGESRYWLNTRTSLVGFVVITNEQQALDFVRLFSLRKTHYLFDDADFLELPAYKNGSSFWYSAESAQNARDAGIPIDSPPVEVTKTNTVFRITRYAMDWKRNILKVVENVETNGTYRISDRRIVASDIDTLMPRYE